MRMFHLLIGQFMSLRMNLMAGIMLVLVTVRTFMSGDAIALTGLCMAFLPFFSQTKHVTCFAADVTEERELFSRYIMSYLLMIVGLFYLKGITTLGACWFPGYVENPLLRETFALVIVCNLCFISILVPLTYSLNLMQRFLTGGMLALIEIAFMSFAKYALTVMDGSFSLLGHWGLYALIVMIPMTELLSVKLNGLLQKRYGKIL